jgi:hypothetical protein
VLSSELISIATMASVASLLFLTFMSLANTIPVFAQSSNDTLATNNTTGSALTDTNSSILPIPNAQTENGNSSQEVFRTFYVRGSLDSSIITGERIPVPNSTAANNNNATIEHPPYLVSGQWALGVENGTVKSLTINFTMVHTDGYERHTHNITNFGTVGSISNVNSVQMQDGYTYITGVADILENNALAWSAIPIELRIEHYNVMNITMDNALTDNHFYSQSLFGVVQTLLDSSGIEIKLPTI